MDAAKLRPVNVARADVIAYRLHRHQLDRGAGSAAPTSVDLLDFGVQDTGTQGSAWALEIRGAKPARANDLVLAWTIRGAPHAYRRRDVAAITVATAPFSEADAASRVFDASKPLRDNGIEVLDALTTVAEHMRDIARKPVSKGEMSTKLTALLDKPFVRYCRVCTATHSYEQTFRLTALQAGLELEPGTSPPVLRRIPKQRPAPYKRLGTEAAARFHVIRGYLRFFGPASVKAIASYLDAPVAEVNANLPDDVIEVGIDKVATKTKRYLLAEDEKLLAGAADRATTGVARLLGSHDPYLQLRDRDVLVDETKKQKDLWRTPGRPGAVVVDGEVAATWRGRAAKGTLSIELEQWKPIKGKTRTALEQEAERLASHRGLTLGSVSR
jgi:hypothetical protein